VRGLADHSMQVRAAQDVRRNVIAREKATYLDLL
jgi:hypothetical protein